MRSETLAQTYQTIEANDYTTGDLLILAVPLILIALATLFAALSLYQSRSRP